MRTESPNVMYRQVNYLIIKRHTYIILESIYLANIVNYLPMRFIFAYFFMRLFLRIQIT